MHIVKEPKTTKLHVNILIIWDFLILCAFLTEVWLYTLSENHRHLKVLQSKVDSNWLSSQTILHTGISFISLLNSYLLSQSILFLSLILYKLVLLIRALDTFIFTLVYLLNHNRIKQRKVSDSV